MKKFRISMNALAVVEGEFVIEAESVEEAEAKVLEQTGDVLWEYRGIQDETVEIIFTQEE